MQLFNRCVKARFVVVKTDSYSAVNVPTATCPVFPKTNCLELLRARTTFVGFGSSGNTHTVNCYLLSGSYA